WREVNRKEKRTRKKIPERRATEGDNPCSDFAEYRKETTEFSGGSFSAAAFFRASWMILIHPNPLPSLRSRDKITDAKVRWPSRPTG
ncbi:MAG TPA: hypothetical protein VI382_00670, partial [Candidatus Manganitrophaceae bacterium]|nr:hypothetical protein [Candidatus Manganitrophaceae bacterium]